MGQLFRRHRVELTVVIVVAAILAVATFFTNVRIGWLEADALAPSTVPNHYELVTIERQGLQMFVGFLEILWVILGILVFVRVSYLALHLGPGKR